MTSGVQRLLDARGQRGSWMPSKIFSIHHAKFQTTFFYQLSNFKTIRSLDAPSRRACFKKNSSLHIWPKMFRTTFLGILPPNLQFYPSKILMTFFSPPLFTISYPCAFDRLPRISCSLTPNFRHINLLTIVFLGFYLNYIFFSRKF